MYLIYAAYSIIILASSIVNTSRRKRQKKQAVIIRETAYAQIDKFHDYLQRGVITQEEYEDNRRRILESLEENN